MLRVPLRALRAVPAMHVSQAISARRPTLNIESI